MAPIPTIARSANRLDYPMASTCTSAETFEQYPFVIKFVEAAARAKSISSHHLSVYINDES